jgi:hypothetical protein
VSVSTDIFSLRHCIAPLIGSDLYSEQQTDKDAINYQYFYNMFRLDWSSSCNSITYTKQKIISEKKVFCTNVNTAIIFKLLFQKVEKY